MSSAMGVVPFTFTPTLSTELDSFKSGSKHFVSMAVEPGCKIGLSPGYKSITSPPNISGMVGSGSLTEHVDSSTPSFCVVRCVGNAGSEPVVKFVYVCPEGSMVKAKMQASTAKSSALSNLRSMGLEISDKVEVCEADEVDEAIKPKGEEEGATSKAAEINHMKPKRKGRGKARIAKFNFDDA